MITEQRLLSVDFLRGLTVAGMILVNNPGDWGYIYAPFQHAAWNGCTPTDLVFPFFLFIVGISICISFSKLLEKGEPKSRIYLKILKRTIILFLLGLMIHAFPFTPEFWKNLRIPGVLQRISLVFLFCSLIYIHFSVRQQVFITVLILLAYWGLMTLVPVPGVGEPDLGKDTNLGAWLDRLLLEGHLWAHSRTWDPEGLLSTLPAIGTGMLGVLTGVYLKQSDKPGVKVVRLLLAGGILVLAGLSWNLVFPINKSLWTSSYVCYTGGIALIVLGICYLLIDVYGHKRWTKPFVYFGSNAITIYVASEVIAKIFYLVTFEQNSNQVTLKSAIFSIFNVSWLGPYNASLLLAVIWVSIFWLLAWAMFRKKIFIKV